MHQSTKKRESGLNKCLVIEKRTQGVFRFLFLDFYSLLEYINQAIWCWFWVLCCFLFLNFYSLLVQFGI